METVIIVVVLLAVAIYYGLAKLLDKVARIGDRELDYLDEQHEAAIINRKERGADKLTDENVAKAMEFSAKLAAIRAGVKPGEENNG